MAKKKIAVKNSQPDELVDVRLELTDSALDAIISIGQEQLEYITNLKAALDSNDDVQLKFWARKLTGMPDLPILE